MESPLLLQYCIRVIFQESFDILHIETIKCLSLVSRDIHNNIIKPYIENNYWFVLFYEGMRTTHYQPKRVSGITSLSQVSLLPNEIDDTKKQNFINNITHLEFDYYFDSPLENLLLPQNIVYLDFGICFNYPIDNLLPPNLEILHFGWYYNHSVDHLPPNLKKLQFGTYFNHSIDHLPPNLTHLLLKYDFNQSIMKLPSSLIELKLGGQFNQTFPPLPHLTALIIDNEKFDLTLIPSPPTSLFPRIQSIVIANHKIFPPQNS